tara:strand:- start:694 stop:1605 length:912 start_codon:yes stop_codon:yes gene_type:complete
MKKLLAAVFVALLMVGCEKVEATTKVVEDDPSTSEAVTKTESPAPDNPFPVITLTKLERYTFGLALLIVGPFCCFFGFNFWRKNQRIHRIMTTTSTSKIAKLAKGPAEVRGSIETSQAPLSSPWGRKQCVYYSFQVTEPVDGGGTITHINDVKSIPFTVKDDTGQVEIDSRNLEFDLKTDHSWETGFWSEQQPPEYLKSLLEKQYGMKTKGKDLSFTEFSLEPGETVYVFGNAIPKKSVQSNKENSDTNGASFVLGDGRMPLIITDKGCQAIESSTRGQSIFGITLSFIGAIVAIVGLLMLIY